MITAVALGVTACGSLKGQVTNDNNPSEPPPIVTKIRGVGQAAATVLPGPTGDLVGVLCGALSAAAAGFSVWHGKKAKAHAMQAKAHSAIAELAVEAAKKP